MSKLKICFVSSARVKWCLEFSYNLRQLVWVHLVPLSHSLLFLLGKSNGYLVQNEAKRHHILKNTEQTVILIYNTAEIK